MWKMKIFARTKLLIAQKEEAGIQLQAEKFDLMVVVGDIDEIDKVNANCILMQICSKNRHRVLRLTKLSSMIQMDQLRNEATRNSESYKEYYAIASGAESPNTKASVRKKQSSSDTTMPPPTATGRRLKTSAKVGQPAKEKQPAKSSTAKGLTVLSEVALTEKSSEDDDDEEKISKHDDDVDDQSDDDDQDDDEDEQTNLDNEDDDSVHPKFSTHDEEDKDKESFKPIVQTPSQVENTNDEDNDEDSHGQQQSLFVLSRFVSNMLNPSLDTGIDSIFESTPRVDALVMTTAELPLLSTTTLPPPSIPLISHVQQTPAPSPANVPSSSLQDLPNFGSLFGFDHRLKTLETNFSEFMQTNQFAKAISSIPGIVDKYINHRMNEAVKVAVRLQSDRL
nr:hypothetical protein [Tanacetum cinerariifolium]